MTAGFLPQWLLFVFLNICAAGIAFVLAWQDETRRSRLVEFVAAWVTLFLAVIVLTETALGLLGILTPLALALALGAGAAVAWYSFARRGHRLVAPVAWRESLQRLRPAAIDGAAWLTLALSGWLAFALTLTALLEPSGLWDTLVYHLPTPVDWLQRGRFTLAYYPFAEVANSYFPGNGELLYFWTLAPFRSDVLVRLAPVGMWALLGFAVWRLGRQAGGSRASAAAAALLLLFTPLVLSQSNELWTDGALAALFALALGHLLAYARRPTLSAAALTGLAAGLMLGVKYSGPAYLAFLLAGFAAVMLSHRRERRAFPKSAAFVFLLAALVTGGYWYLRNFIVAGNPVYPMRLSIGGRVLLPGPGSSFGDAIWDVAASIDKPAMAAALIDTYGLFFLLAAGVTVLLAPWRVFLAQRRDATAAPMSRGLPILVAALGLASLLLYLNTPYSVMRYSPATPITAVELAGGMRFSLPAAVCAAALIAAGLAALRARPNPVWALALGGIVMGALIGYAPDGLLFFPAPVFTHSRLELAGGALLLVLFGRRALVAVPARLRLRVSPRSMGRFKMLAGASFVAVMLIAGLAVGALKDYREGYRYALYQARYGETAQWWRWVDENINGARIAYIGDTRIYPLMGVELNNELRYINIAGGLAERFDDYEARGTINRAGGSYAAWARNLADWSAQYLVVSAENPLSEERWAQEHPDLFALVFNSPVLRVYRIDKESLTRNAPAQ